ncbi:hypothetical protein TRAPUB_3987 [Trametes pubescens]|uniref:Uncharacterized protein n=1 Tax=Trametes pubescens TaxID=154538 RepID=A0A1M2VCA0_TRAPU|nr:hypothetical protein TRAPUB_3987 [Trametes pubescens]
MQSSALSKASFTMRRAVREAARNTMREGMSMKKMILDVTAKQNVGMAGEQVGMEGKGLGVVGMEMREL